MSVQCEVDKTFVYNHRFECLVGNEYWVDGEIRFPESLDKETVERVVVDVSFAHSGVILKNSDHNVRLAMRRVTCIREPGVLVDGLPLHTLLTMNQLAYIREERGALLALFDFHKQELEGEWLLNPIVLLEQRAALPHEKRELRMRTAKEIFDLGLMFEEWKTKHYIYKLKRNEFAKPNKYGRMIGDLGTMASLVGAFFVDVCKTHLEANPINIGGNTATFVKAPKASLMEDLFAESWTGHEDYTIFVHSDDSLLSIRTQTGRRVFNMDISSCDASHSVALFELLEDLYPDPHSIIKQLGDQCRSEICIRSVDRASKVLLRPDGPVLYSGSTLTTLINTVACILIFHSIVHCKAQSCDEIIQAARDVGYLVTLEECHEVSDMQFLKHSPVLKHGKFIPVKNFGVFVRSWGVSKKKLPKYKGLSPEDVSTQYQGLLLNGIYGNVTCPFLTWMRSRYPFKYAKKLAKLVEYEPLDIAYSLTDEEFFSRYHSAGNDSIGQLYKLLGDASAGDVVYSDLADLALRMDYGLHVGWSE